MDDGTQLISIRDPGGAEYLYPVEAFKYYYPEGTDTDQAVFTNPNPNANWLERLFTMP